MTWDRRNHMQRLRAMTDRAGLRTWPDGATRDRLCDGLRPVIVPRRTWRRLVMLLAC